MGLRAYILLFAYLWFEVLGVEGSEQVKRSSRRCGRRRVKGQDVELKEQ